MSDDEYDAGTGDQNTALLSRLGKVRCKHQTLNRIIGSTVVKPSNDVRRDLIEKRYDTHKSQRHVSTTMALSSFAPTFSALCIVILVATCSVCLSLSIDQRKYIDRRTFGKMIGALSIPTTNIIALTHAPFLAHAASDDDESSPAATIEEIAAKTIARRLQDDILQQPPISSTPSERNGVDNTYYPDFLQGTWAVRALLTWRNCYCIQFD